MPVQDKKVDKEKILRVFTQIAVIPFQKVTGVQTLNNDLEMKASLHSVLSKAVLSVGILVELRDDFKRMGDDPSIQQPDISMAGGLPVRHVDAVKLRSSPLCCWKNSG